MFSRYESKRMLEKSARLELASKKSPMRPVGWWKRSVWNVREQNLNYSETLTYKMASKTRWHQNYCHIWIRWIFYNGALRPLWLQLYVPVVLIYLRLSHYLWIIWSFSCMILSSYIKSLLSSLIKSDKYITKWYFFWEIP